LITTRRFSESFGCPFTERKKVKAWFREQVQSSGMLDGMVGAETLLEEEDIDLTVQSTLPILEQAEE
jgi:hypothetical protein